MTSEIQEWLLQQGQWLRRDHDRLLPVTGDRRIGKSTASIYMAIFLDPDFSLQDQVAWTAKQFTTKARELAKYKPIILDEGIRGLMSMDALSEDNKHLAKFATVAGERNLFGFLLLPMLHRLSGIFREDYCEFAVQIQSRGQALLQRLRLDNRPLEWPMPVLPFTFPQLPPRIEDEYRRLKTEYVQRFDDGQSWDIEATLRFDIRRRIGGLVKGLRLVEEDA